MARTCAITCAMFTGLVQCLGRVEHITVGTEQRTFVIAAALPPAARSLGASVSVSGVCLTVTAATAHDFTVEAAFETLAVTKLGHLHVGDRVNLEPALCMGDALGGHLVSGHVDGLARVRKCEARGEALEFVVDAPTELLGFIAVKGSVCLDGVSLTVNAVDATGFAVGLIPHTLAVTTLGTCKVGDALHLEVDLLARYVARLLEHQAVTSPVATAGISPATLARAGFIATPSSGGRPTP